MAKHTSEGVERDERDPRVVVKSMPIAGTNERVNDISRTGALIVTSTPLPVGTTIELKFPIPGAESVTLEGIGEVVRNHADPVGMGVQFITLSEKSLVALNEMLAANMLKPTASPGTGKKPDGVKRGRKGR